MSLTPVASLFLLTHYIIVIVVITVFIALFLYCTLFSYSAIQPQVCNKLSVQFKAKMADEHSKIPRVEEVRARVACPPSHPYVCIPYK